MQHGRFIIIEGPDGSGKSTCSEAIARMLASQGEDVVIVRSPGSTGLGEYIRDFFKASVGQLKIEDQIAMLLLSKRAMIDEILTPSLKEGKTVICDRFVDSLFAYQWAGLSNFDPAIKKRIEDNLIVYGIDIEPDLKIVLDCPVDVSDRRLNNRRANERDTLDLMNLKFKNRVREYYAKHLRESAHGHTVFVNSVEGVENMVAVVKRLVSVLMYNRPLSRMIPTE